MDERDLELQLNASGERLDNLTNVARVSLPPWGPWLAQGAFKVSKRAARNGRNPQTGKPIKIAARKVAKFKAGLELASKIK